MKKMTKDLEDWCNQYIEPMMRKTINKNTSSYALKHAAEHMLGRYVSNEELKECLELFPHDQEMPNPSYALDQKLYQYLMCIGGVYDFNGHDCWKGDW